ncbi:MAG TPA: exodeoxyribonuclease III [Marinobacterium sp.]|nr:exodeoxyribonuclease III [Marinobacterium sp.]
MLLISFNVNGIRARLHQIEAVISKYQPDVIGLQETKVADDQFPFEAIEALGYQAYVHGQKTHYGVALLSKQPALAIQRGFASDSEESQKRLIVGDFATENGQTVRVINGYFPQGENIKHEVKFPAKRKFYADLNAYLRDDNDPTNAVAVMGDLNISPTDLDIGIGEDNRKRWLKTGKTSFQPEEREWLGQLHSWGLVDSFREMHPEQTGHYSWFDYRSRGFEDDPRRGLRIDAILTTPSLQQSCVETGIDLETRGMEKPSDHAPVFARFAL